MSEKKWMDYKEDVEDEYSEYEMFMINWYRSITKEESLKRMGTNYLLGVTEDGEFTREEARELIEGLPMFNEDDS